MVSMVHIGTHTHMLRAKADTVDQIRKELFNPASGKVLVAAHRGDWRNACENSREAIENAVQMGVDIVEVDLARTKDGHLILLHDNTLDRTTTGTWCTG